MNARSVSDERPQRVSQPLPVRLRPAAVANRAAAAAAGAVNGVLATADAAAATVALKGPSDNKATAPLRRAATDLEEVEAGLCMQPETQHIGDTAHATAQSARRRHAKDACNKTAVKESGSTTRTDGSKKTYDDDEGYYIHVPHDQMVQR